jgi:hypothetical protein
VRERESSYVAQKRERRSPIQPPRDPSDDEISLTAHDALYDESDGGEVAPAVASVPVVKPGGGAKSVSRPVVVAKEPAVASVKPGCAAKAVKEPAVASVASVKPGCEAKAVSRPAMAAKEPTLQVTVEASFSGEPSRVVVERGDEKERRVSKKGARCAERAAEQEAAKKRLYKKVFADISAM